ncbi:MAG: hypothetical protein WD045_17670 [Pirellulaceae bacterium]
MTSRSFSRALAVAIEPIWDLGRKKLIVTIVRLSRNLPIGGKLMPKKRLRKKEPRSEQAKRGSRLDRCATDQAKSTRPHGCQGKPGISAQKPFQGDFSESRGGVIGFRLLSSKPVLGI